MPDALPPWEPPFAGTEAEHLVGALDRLRAISRWKADGLDAAGLRARVGACSLTPRRPAGAPTAGSARTPRRRGTR